MNRDTIQKTIDRLQAIAGDNELRHHFDLGFWGNKDEIHAVDQPEDPDCGFAGCFIGWAVHQQWYAEDGLVLGLQAFRNPVGRTDWMPFVTFESHERFEQYKPSFGRNAEPAMRAVGEVLGLELGTMQAVVFSEAYPTGRIWPEDVADRLRIILENGEDRALEIFEREVREAEEIEDNEDEHSL
jgi:hypothetical protein